MTLHDVLAAAADEAGVKAEPATYESGGNVWGVDGRPFATLDVMGAIASFRLDAELAGAALRTPDVKASFLGPEWVEFRPSAMDDHAADRAAAWFLAAFRRAV